LSQLGPIYRHDDFLVWDAEPTSKGKDRHLFLFKNKLLLTKKRKPETEGELPTYEFRGLINLPETLLNDELDSDRRFELCFDDIRQGKYTFQAKTVPIKQAWCDLLRRWLPKWGAKPGFTVPLPVQVSCKEGEEIKLRCKLQGQPLPQVTWYWNDVPIEQSSDKYSIVSDYSECFLVAPRPTVDMSGNYTVTVSNKYGTDSSSTVLTVEEVLEKPVFNTDLSNAETLLGEDANFACKLSGKPAPKITWCRDGEELMASDRVKFMSPDSRTHILRLSRVEEADLGVYECKATNKVGTLSSKAKLIITDLEERKKERAPEFLSNFNDVLVLEGKEAKLSLRFIGYPQPEVEWLFNGQKLDKSELIDATFDGEQASLLLRATRPEHSGQYTCRLFNKFGLAEVTAQLSVAVKPQLQGQIAGQEVTIGDEVHFKCNYTGFPLPDITWYHNKLPLTDTERMHISRTADSASLTIKTVMRHDDGEYYLRLANVAGEAKAFTKLSVLQPVELEELTAALEALGITDGEKQTAITYAPSFTKRLQSQDVLQGAPVKFSCKTIGEPRPSVTWLKDGKPIEEREDIVFDADENTFRLVIRQVQESDAGLYQCIISNSAGETRCTATLTVQSAEVEEEETVDRRKRKWLNCIICHHQCRLTSH